MIENDEILSDAGFSGISESDELIGWKIPESRQPVWLVNTSAEHRSIINRAFDITATVDVTRSGR